MGAGKCSLFSAVPPRNRSCSRRKGSAKRSTMARLMIRSCSTCRCSAHGTNLLQAMMFIIGIIRRAPAAGEQTQASVAPGLLVFDACADRADILAVIEGHGGSAGAYFRQPFVGYHLEFHHGLMGGAVQFRGLEQAYVVGTPFVLHEIVDVPGRRRRAPGEV